MSELVCPHRYYDGILNGIAGFEGQPWMCRLAFQRCPTGKLENFDFNECSTYKEAIKRK